MAQEHGMQNLTVPTSVFYGRKKRAQDLAGTGYVHHCHSHEPVDIQTEADMLIDRKTKVPNTHPLFPLSHSRPPHTKLSSLPSFTHSLLHASMVVWAYRTMCLMLPILRSGRWVRLSSRIHLPSRNGQRSRKRKSWFE